MSEFGSTYEHVVQKQNDSAMKRKKILLWTLIVLSAAGLLWLGLCLEFLPLALGVVMIGGFLAVLYMRRFSRIEYEYQIFEGTAVFSEILGNVARRQVLSFDIRRCERIAPLSDEKWARFAEEYPAETVYSALSSPDAANVYFAAFEGEKGRKTIVYFEMTARALKLFRAANPQAVVMTAIPE